MDITRGYRRYVLGILLVVSTFNFIDRQLLAVLSPVIKAELLLSDTQLGVLKGIAFALFYAVMGIPLAALADRTSRVNLIGASIAVWSAMTALTGGATTFLHLFLTRIGVGVGEAGVTPACHSLLSDYYSKAERSTALAIFTLGVPIGTLFGFLAGGFLTQELGWRLAFVIVGLPGLLIGLLIKLTVTEPLRGSQDAATGVAAERLSVAAGMRQLWQIPSYRVISIGGALCAFCGYAISMWLVDFLFRSHNLNYGDVTLQLSLAIGVGGGVGTYAGGAICDRFGPRNVSLYLWLPGLAMLLVCPFMILALWTSNQNLMFGGLFLVFALLYFFFGPFYGVVQSLAPVRARALATALLFFIMSAFGSGLGPLFVGMVSDYLTPSHGGADALRIALTIVAFLSALSGLFLIIRSGGLKRDLDIRAQQI